jgi:thiol:disulfide interchange protein DsbD
MITADEAVLTKTKFYTPDAGEFIDWLNCGLETFKKIRR